MNLVTSIAQIDIFISEKFTLAEKQEIINGITEWQKAAKGLISFHIIDFNSKELIPNEYSNAWYAINILPIHKDSVHSLRNIVGGRVIGYAHSLFGCNFIGLCTEFANGEKLRKLVMHEIGHHLGLDHIEKKAVMNSMIPFATAKVSKYDLNQLLYVWRDFLSQQ